MPNRSQSAFQGSISTSRNPTGRRPRGPEHFASETSASDFPGLPEGDNHLELKDRLEQLGRKSGMSRALIKHFVLLLEWSRPQDWQTGAQPIVWLSVKETAYRLGISTSQVRRNEKTLHNLGALAWKDSPNHRRFGSRDATGQIVEAYGVNLAPAAALLPELRRLARDQEDDRARWKFLRTRIAACRANLLSAVSTALKSGVLDDREAHAWKNLVAEAIGSIRSHTPLSALERRAADLVLIPCRPAMFDLLALTAAVDIANIAGTPALAVLNAIPPRGKSTEQTRAALAGCGIEIATPMLTHRQAFVHALSRGEGACEFEPRGKASAEILALHDAIARHTPARS